MNFYNQLSVISEPFLDLQRIPYALAAVLISLVSGLTAGGFAGNAYPFYWLLVDKILGRAGDRMDKTYRPKGDLIFRGFMMAALAILLAGLYVTAFGRARLALPAYGLVEALFLAMLLTSSGIWYALSKLYVTIEQKKTGSGGYLILSRTTRSNLTIADDYGISRLGIGLAARAFDKGLVAPLFWYIVGGMPWAVLYATFAALNWRFGKDGFSKGFGSFAAVMERILGFFPSLVSALFIVLAGFFTPSANPFRGLRFLAGLKNRAPYEQGGLPLSALAWTLNISLGGPYQDSQGSAVAGHWVGPGGVTAKTDHKHLRRALFLSVVAHALLVSALCGLYIGVQGLAL